MTDIAGAAPGEARPATGFSPRSVLAALEIDLRLFGMLVALAAILIGFGIVTGGKMVGGKTTRPGQLLGTDIQGGQTHRLTKGDVIVIPAGTPHWFKEVPQSVSYYVVKVIKP